MKTAISSSSACKQGGKVARRQSQNPGNPENEAQLISETNSRWLAVYGTPLSPTAPFYVQFQHPTCFSFSKRSEKEPRRLIKTGRSGARAVSEGTQPAAAGPDLLRAELQTTFTIRDC